MSIKSTNREPVSNIFQCGMKYVDGTSIYANIPSKTKTVIIRPTNVVVSFTIYSDKAYNESKDKTTIFTGLMINLGSTDLPYEPYTGGAPSPSPSYPQEIESAGQSGEISVEMFGKNLIDISSGVKQGYNVTQPNLKLIPGQTYTYTNVDASTGVSLYESTTETNLTKGYPLAGLSKTFVMPDIPNAVVILAGLNGYWNTGDLSKIKIQLELGDKSTPYEPYKPAQTLIVSTPDGLPGIPVSSGGNYTDESGQQWVTDEVDLTKGVYIKRIEKIDFKKIKFSAMNRGQSTGIYFDSIIEKAAMFGPNVQGTICNIAQLGNPWSKTGNYAWALTHMGFNRIRLGFADDAIDSVEKLTALLDRLPEAYAMYCLAEPIESPIPPEDIAAFRKLCMNYPATTIINSDNCGMELTYTADTKAYIDDKIAEISAVIVSK